MRIDLVRIALVIAAVSLVPAASGQVGNIPGTGYTSVPYTALETMTTGSNTQTAILARDAEGRTRQEYISQVNGPEIHSVRIMDPIAGVMLMWAVGNDVQDHIVTMQPLGRGQRGTASVPDNPEPVLGFRPCGGGCKTEILPSQQINGYRCRGFRIQRIVRDPTNKSTSIQTTENWSSPELGVILRHIEVDVLAGRYVSEVNNIVRTDPDPMLFLPPPGYTLAQN